MPWEMSAAKIAACHFDGDVQNGWIFPFTHMARAVDISLKATEVISPQTIAKAIYPSGASSFGLIQVPALVSLGFSLVSLYISFPLVLTIGAAHGRHYMTLGWRIIPPIPLCTKAENE